MGYKLVDNTDGTPGFHQEWVSDIGNIDENLKKNFSNDTFWANTAKDAVGAFVFAALIVMMIRSIIKHPIIWTIIFILGIILYFIVGTFPQ